MKQGRVIINRNICDNAAECGGIAVCPTGALYWDNKSEEVSYNATACIDCGACANEEIGCPVGAILWGIDDEDYEAKNKIVEEETMTLEKLEVDRYGAMPIKAEIALEKLDDVIKSSDAILLVEVFAEETINCLIKSIPYSDISSSLPFETKIVKIAIEDNSDFEQYTIKELPSLVIFKNGSVIGSVEGYFTVENQEEFIEQIKHLLK